MARQVFGMVQSTSGVNMSRISKCPVCGFDLGSQIPDFCPVCVWECGTDITLLPSLNTVTSREIEYYQRKLFTARERWKQAQELTQIKTRLTKDIVETRQQKAVSGQTLVPSTSSAIEMVMVEGGTFLMGSQHIGPIHNVSLSSFYMGKFLVTQKQWLEIMHFNPSRFKGSQRPVEKVRWHEAISFCNLLSLSAGIEPSYSLFGVTDPTIWSSKIWRYERIFKIQCNFMVSGFRLPTEAEWEFAAMGGSRSKGYKYSGSNDIDKVVWNGGNSGGKTHTVGEKGPNELGIYDLSGNVDEWCWDQFDHPYHLGSQVNPIGPSLPPDPLNEVVYRGGNWQNTTRDFCEVKNRNHAYPRLQESHIGFRLCRSVTADQ